MDDATEATHETNRALWSALRMIREAVEAHAPAGALPAAEHTGEAGLDPIQEAEALVAAILAIAPQPNITQAKEWHLMDAIEALKHIRVLLKPAREVDDAAALHLVIREVKSIIDKALAPSPGFQRQVTDGPHPKPRHT